jgi:hypothetical protein
MTIAAATLRVSGVVAVVCVVLSVSVIWLVLSDPVAVATAVQSGDLSSAYTLVSHVIVETLRALLKYL